VSASGTSVQATYFLAFDLAGASAQARAVGKVDGYLLNNYAIDIVDDVLRVATSIQSSWVVTPVVMEDGASTDGVNITEEPSSTQNYVITLQLPSMESGAESSMMEELGRLKLGKPNELFTAVRFFDNIAYAVTFERKDPFYVLDLTDPRNPVILAELEISGFSQYLHPMNADNTLLIAIGQEADQDGNILGVQITVFDVRDPSNPVPAVRHTIEQSTDSYSSSQSLDDFKATRYAGERLIIPMDVWGYNGQESFHGFITYYVNATHIEPECRISHDDRQTATDVPIAVADEGSASNGTATDTDFGVEIGAGTTAGSAGGNRFLQANADVCYYCAHLPPRSMIFDGNLMTMNNHFIRSNSLNTCEQVWSLDIDIMGGGSNMGCCGAFGYW